jgi:thiol-disulfide isomerase/thioredoxin
MVMENLRATPLVAATIFVASVLAVASVAKLVDWENTKTAVTAFGMPTPLARAAAGSLIFVELAVAAILLLTPWTLAGAVSAFALFIGFGGAVAVNILRGRTPECHCFGGLTKGTVNWSTAARNALLATMTAFVVAGGRAPSLFGGILASIATLWLVLRRFSPVRAGAGTIAPRFSLLDDTGQLVSLDGLLSRSLPVLLVFVSPRCGACQALLPSLRGWQHDLGGQLGVAVVQTGSPNDDGAGQMDGLGSVLMDRSGAVARAYGVHATPSCVLVNRRGHIESSAAGGAEIAKLVDLARKRDVAPRLTRRTMLQWTTAGALPVLAAACGGSTGTSRRPKVLHIDGAYLCDQRYALCTNAACHPSPSNANVVICKCVVVSGYSVGFKSCEERAPRGTTLHSNFSTQLVTSHTAVLSCPEKDPWANCLDVACTVDPTDPTKANCQCILVRTGPSLTFGGECDTSSCSSVIWSAATPELPGSKQLTKGMHELGLPLDLPRPCPHH